MNSEVLHGACHFGRAKFEVCTAVEPALRCDCSPCRRKGALMTPLFLADGASSSTVEDV